MKRLITIVCLLLVVSMVAGSLIEATAAIKVTNIGRSLNSMTAPVRGATAPPWNYSTGLRAVGKGARAYFKVDTLGSGATGSPTWTLVSKPSGSVAVLDSANGNFLNSILTDLVGQYIVSATVGAQSANDTIFASTYAGTGFDAQAGCFCHPTASAIKTGWLGTGHGTMFTRGITGYQEVEHGMGAYAGACIKCHTVGYQTNADNNNWYKQARATGWDTTWYAGLPSYGGDYWITTGDTSIYHTLSASQRMVSDIGCEVCHGPATDHKLTADKSKIGKSISSDVCNQCHDGSRRHSLGTFYNLSLHAKLPTGTVSEGGRSNCQPCHTGKGFLYYLDHNKDTTGIGAAWNLATDANTQISCQVCHDPHSAANPAQLRTVTLKGDSLRSGYVLPANLRSGTGLLCVNCHAARYDVRFRVKPNSPPMYGFAARFGPHENPQGDMFFGTSGYQYGDSSITGLTTHTGVEGFCTGCHMQGRMNRLDGSANTLPNHTFSMEDTTYATGVYKPTQVCVTCHGEIEDFNDVRAFYDYDRNGRIEGVQTEIAGLLDALRLTLPRDTTGEPIGNGTLTHADSVAIQTAGFRAVAGIWNYRVVKNDKSLGVHNAKYAVAILYKSLGWQPLSVKELPGMPTEFAIQQNYPNPFNPSTSIRFSVPKESRVKIEVYNVAGQLVKTLLDEALRAGNKEVVWDGTAASGAKVASGMYLYRIQAGDYTAVKKMVMLK
jgi:predicted CXXCH cytochrome family protein